MPFLKSIPKLIFSFLLILIFFKTLAHAQSRKNVVAIIDTGINLSAAELKNKIWINKAEIPNNGMDDDQNGLIDDIHGWDFSSDSNNLMDSHGHGTHIASLIAPAAEEKTLMIIKYYNEKSGPEKNFKNCLKAFAYAIEMGAEVINFSGGGYGAHPDEKAILEQAEKNNILIISAAGNDHLNNDLRPFFPASYKLPNIISVGSLSTEGQLSRFSNFGRDSVSLFYRGEKVLGLGLDLKAVYLSGTSQATALVTAEILNWLKSQQKRKISAEQEPSSLTDLAAKIKLTSSIDQRLHLEKTLLLRDSHQTAFGQNFRKAYLRPQIWLE